MLEIEIWSDFVCPFCYIGKRNIEMALDRFSDKSKVRVTYRSFELDPDAKKSQRVSIDEVLAKKYGRTLDWAQKMNAHVTGVAAESGVRFAMDKVVPTNSFDAHRLSHIAAESNLQETAQERLFAAYFTEGKDIASLDVLREIAADIGLDSSDVVSKLSADFKSKEVRADENAARSLGVQGVPFFLFNRELAVSGAQPVEVFIEAFSEALKQASGK